MTGRWYEVNVSFWAKDADDAENVLDRITNTVCEGTGEGDNHECKRDWVAGLQLLAHSHAGADD